MAVEPLFVVEYAGPTLSLDRLKEMSRFKPVAMTETTLNVFDRVVQQVRVHLYTELGAGTVTDILAITPVENPTTADQFNYLRAELLEANWVMYILLSALPVAVYDSFVAEPPAQVWNKEPLTRDIDPDMLEEIRAMLWDEIQKLIGDITGEVSDVVKVATIGPSEDRTIHLPGSSILPYGQFLRYQGYDASDTEGTILI